MIASFKPIWRRSDDESVSLIIHFAVILSVCLSMTAVSVAADSKSPAARTRVSGPKPKPVKPRVAKDVERAIERGVAFLLKDQNEPGSWGSPHQTKGLNIYAPVPGAHHAFRTAVTAMCVMALIEVDSDRKDVLAAIERGEAWLLERLPRLRRATPDALYNVWGHAYAIQALVRMHDRVPAGVGQAFQPATANRQAGKPAPLHDKARREKIVQLIKDQIGFLDRYESVDGGWGYYDFRLGSQKPASSSMSFVNATVLVAFHEAESVGVRAPEKLVRRAIAATNRQRKPDFSYVYGEYLKMRPMMPINRPGGSLGRSQACNLALRLHGDERITDELLKVWLDRLFARNGWLDIGRKRPVPHESWFQVAGYFFYYGHYYAALCIEQLQPEERSRFQDHLAAILLRLQEKDGSWWDYPLYNYHQQYGTAFALMSLVRCRETRQTCRRCVRASPDLPLMSLVRCRD